MKAVLGEFQSILFLICGVVLITTLSMPWINAPILSFMGMSIRFEANSQEELGRIQAVFKNALLGAKADLALPF